MGYRLLGDRDHAAKYLRRIVEEMPETAYAERATSWLANSDAVGRQVIPLQQLKHCLNIRRPSCVDLRAHVSARTTMW